MCGIFGITHLTAQSLPINQYRSILKELFLFSESRGKEASGLALSTGERIHVLKGAVSASEFTKKPVFRAACAAISPYAIGHSRLVTNGNQLNEYNNQPVVKEGSVCVHNGIIVNDTSLWAQFHQLSRALEVDTEIIPTLFNHFYQMGFTEETSLAKVFSLIEGTASVAFFPQSSHSVILATNNGSLYYLRNEYFCVFASEEIILQRISRNHKVLRGPISQVSPQQAIHINNNNLADPLTFFKMTTNKNEAPLNRVPLGGTPKIHTITITNVSNHSKTPPQKTNTPISEGERTHYNREHVSVDKLKRCSRCVLPETMPFIRFDPSGVCNYCLNHVSQPIQGEEKLQQRVTPFHTKGRVNCLVTLSGGRDSSFGLHYVKNILKLNPVSYTYDWGMVTDLARRNQARLCGKLGIEHILVSADITKKRTNIRNNVLAWLKKPSLGTIPLFMAGDKQYFYYTNKIRKQLGLDLVFLCENMLENTGFKSGFCGIPPTFKRNHTYTLSLLNKLKMAFFYAQEYATNPAYLNSSLVDTMGAFVSYYFIPHNYINLFDYVPWDEKRIDATLAQYHWEKATDTNSTWRIGDGTAAFYNFIYYHIAGFTENDTFRSNQIREGMITREQAINTIAQENQPRFESIRWYCDTIGIDMRNTIETILKIPPLSQFK